MARISYRISTVVLITILIELSQLAQFLYNKIFFQGSLDLIFFKILVFDVMFELVTN